MQFTELIGRLKFDDELSRMGAQLDSSVAFDCRIQFLSDGFVRFFFRVPPSHPVWKVMRYMDFQPEDRRNQIWVRKSGWHWSAKELVDTINFVHLAIHHGYVIPGQRYFDYRQWNAALIGAVRSGGTPLEQIARIWILT